MVLQDFADCEKQNRGSWIQVTDYDPAAKCFRMTPAVYNDEFAAMAIGYANSAPNILMWLVFTPSGSFLYRSDQGAIPLVNPEHFPARSHVVEHQQGTAWRDWDRSKVNNPDPSDVCESSLAKMAAMQVNEMGLQPSGGLKAQECRLRVE